MNLKPADEWLLKEKCEGKFITDIMEKQKAGKGVILTNDDTDKIGADKNEIIKGFNQVFAALVKYEVYLGAELNSHGKIQIIRIRKKIATNRARNLRDKISNEYRNLIVQEYEKRYKSEMISEDTPPSKTPMQEPIGYEISEKPLELTEKQKKNLRAGLEDRSGTRVAAKG
jgi:hypothetical protein